MGSIITVDAVTALPFAKLREENKASAYVKIRVVTILVNLFFCIVFTIVHQNFLTLLPVHTG